MPIVDPLEQERGTMSEQVSYKSELRKQYEAEWGETVPDGDSDRPPYIPWLEARLSKMDKDWLLLLREISVLDTETDWHGAADHTFQEQFDPRAVIRALAGESDE
jgi:hypothetical protein